MKQLFLVLMLCFFSFAASAVNYSSDCKLSVAGHCFTASENARFESNTVTAGGGVTLLAHVLTTSRFSYLHLPGSPATAFQVGGAVTMRCPAMRLTSNAAGAVGAELTYSDDAAIYDDTTMINIVYQNGTAAAPAVGLPATGWGATPGELYMGSGFTIPSSKYPSFLCGGGSCSLTVYCFID